MLLGFSGCTAQTLLAYWRALLSSNVGDCFFYVTLKRISHKQGARNR